MSKIVIIDDCKSTLKYMDVILSKIGHKVFTFNRPNDAVNIVPALSPDIIICDYMMFDMDGITTIEKLRVAYKNPLAKYILLTSMHDKELMDECETKDITFIQKLGPQTKLLEGIKCLK